MADLEVRPAARGPARGPLRRRLHRFVPAHFRDPLGLALRLCQSGDRAALFAMQQAALGIVLTPVDLLLLPLEHRRYRRAPAPRLPMVLVCGPARSGTTQVAQVLMRNLPVAYFTNLTAVFPRSPLTAMWLPGRLLPRRAPGYQSYYGKTRYWSGPNDALQIWDRWLGPDRTAIPEALAPEQQAAMRRFFGAFEALTGRPLVAKNNSLNASAHLVGEVFPQARFLCLVRDRVALAASLLRARREIHGTEEVPYGLAQEDDTASDPVLGVCRQVLFHEALAARQVERLGPERFRLVAYEAFCRDPRALVRQVGEQILGRAPTAEELDPALQSFDPRGRERVEPALRTALEAGFARLSSEVPARGLDP